jgi:hypothetical protein
MPGARVYLRARASNKARSTERVVNDAQTQS